jgi:hypothetical protein
MLSHTPAKIDSIETILEAEKFAIKAVENILNMK